MPDWLQRASQWLDCTREVGHGDGVLAVRTSEPCSQRCHPGDSLRLLKGPPPSSLLSSSSSFLFPSAFNWKCIYCRARGWTGEKEAQQLMKMWLRWGPQGLAPLQHHQLTHTVNFSPLSLFFGCSLVYCSLTYFSHLTPSVCFSFLSESCLSFLPSCLFYSLSLFSVLDWACIRPISNANANGAAWIDRSFVLPTAICSKESFNHFKSIFFQSPWSFSTKKGRYSTKKYIIIWKMADDFEICKKFRINFVFSYVLVFCLKNV